MCCKKKKKVPRPQRPPKEGPYIKTNAYSIKCTFEQILTLAIMIILISLHSIFVVSPLIKINHPILILLFVLYYLTLIILIRDYIWITTFDPVDPFIIDPISLDRARK